MKIWPWLGCWLVSPIMLAGEGFLEELVAAFKQTRSLQTPFSGNLEQGYTTGTRFAASLTTDWGPVVGYKAALTNPAARARFGVDQPLWGRLLEKMLLANGASLTYPFGARPFAEGDLMVRVGDEALNRAQTPEQALAALDAVMPMLELPDLVYGPGLKLAGPSIAAINTGARYGILGPVLPLESDAAWVRRLDQIGVELVDEQGRTLAQGHTSALMGHPLQVVLWIKNALQRQNLQLAKGDWLSLGAVTPPVFLHEPGVLTARYDGLGPHPIEVSVKLLPAAGDPP